VRRLQEPFPPSARALPSVRARSMPQTGVSLAGNYPWNFWGVIEERTFIPPSPLAICRRHFGEQELAVAAYGTSDVWRDIALTLAGSAGFVTPRRAGTVAALGAYPTHAGSAGCWAAGTIAVAPRVLGIPAGSDRQTGEDEEHPYKTCNPQFLSHARHGKAVAGYVKANTLLTDVIRFPACRVDCVL